MQTHRLTRDGKPPLEFDGEIIAEGTTQEPAGHREKRWHEAKLYRTAAGKWVVQVNYCTIWRGELAHSAAWGCESPGEAARILEWYPPTKYVRVPVESKYDGLRREIFTDMQAGWDALVGRLLDHPEFTEKA